MNPIQNEIFEDDLGANYIISNKDDLYNFLSCVSALKERAVEIANIMLQLEGNKERVYAEDIEIEDDMIGASYTTYHCGDTDAHGFGIPLRYFFDDNWIEEAKEAIRQRQEEEKRKKEEAEAKRKLQEADREYKRYLELKKKFEE